LVLTHEISERNISVLLRVATESRIGAGFRSQGPVTGLLGARLSGGPIVFESPICVWPYGSAPQEYRSVLPSPNGTGVQDVFIATVPLGYTDPLNRWLPSLLFSADAFEVALPDGGLVYSFAVPGGSEERQHAGEELLVAGPLCIWSYGEAPADYRDIAPPVSPEVERALLAVIPAAYRRLPRSRLVDYVLAGTDDGDESVMSDGDAIRVATLAGHGTLYERLGGEAAIKEIVWLFYQRVIADPQLVGYFSGVDMMRQRRHMATFLSGALGGPRTYTGRDLETAHAGVGVRAGGPWQDRRRRRQSSRPSPVPAGVRQGPPQVRNGRRPLPGGGREPDRDA
jgi:Bacterial-like globin